jgi:hypothetical protein
MCDTHIGKEMKIRGYMTEGVDDFVCLITGDMTEGVDEFVCLIARITKHTHELKDIRRIRLAKNNIASYSQ